MSSLSQALRLGDLPPPHRTFQGHATHIIEWSMMLRPNDSWSTCIPQGIATFLHYASRRSAGLRYTARGAEKPFLLAGMDADIPLACLSSGGARQIGAACGCGVHDESPRVALLESVPRRSMPEPPFSLQANLTTVKCGATCLLGRQKSLGNSLNFSHFV